MNIVSLLPSATEIVCALGMGDALVAVTHECDFPPEALAKPHITRSLLRPNMPSGEIDAEVRSQLVADAHSLYSIDRTLLAELAPDVILTQQLCEVCAVAYDEVLDAVKSLPRRPTVLNLEPMSLEDVLEDICRVASALGVEQTGREVVAELEERVARVKETTARAKSRPAVAFLEWIDPLFCGGHWNPQLVEMAGGHDPVGRAHQPSVRIEWEQVRASQPEVMVLSCCGFDEERTRQDLPVLEALPGFSELPCARNGRVHVVNGSAYFSRPGPRLVESLEILARFVHPELYIATVHTEGSFAHSSL